MRVIECIGLPGSGKSTLTPMVKRALHEKGVQVFDASDIVLASDFLPARRLFFHLTNILPTSLRREVLRGLTKIFRIKPKYQSKFRAEYSELFSYVNNRIDEQPVPDAHKFMMRSWFSNLAAFYMISQESSESGTVILEEGFVHKAVTFFVAAGNPDTHHAEITTYLDLIPVPDVLLRIDADVATCRQRLNGRDLPRRLQGKNDEEILDYLHRAESVLEQAEQIMTERGCTVIKLNNARNGVSEKLYARIGNVLSEIDGQVGESRIRVN